ncbi:hypothetical protein DEO72_LG11g2148 [Vigna unguiculata]|uniref:Uncharacterized protein n=1 Tax=Vigna unguiculata TaxID=3917 RepID=A0A4D6NRM6_VIGUN|nr:hypothetical protein DEO72_LG11g2148 [Vigna unguiculata]
MLLPLRCEVGVVAATRYKVGVAAARCKVGVVVARCEAAAARCKIRRQRCRETRHCDRGRCCCSCHYHHKVCSFFPHYLEGISTVTIGRDCIAEIAAPSRVVIYNSDPTRSLKIAYFKWSGIGEDAKDCRLVRSYVLGRDFDNDWVRFWKEPIFEPKQKTGKRKVKVGTQLTWRETHYRLGGKEEFTKTVAELFASVVEGERVPVF